MSVLYSNHTQLSIILRTRTMLLRADVSPNIITFEIMLISALIFFKWLSKKHLDNDPIKCHYRDAFCYAKLLKLVSLFYVII